MNMLVKETCVPCEGNTKPLTHEEIEELMPDVTGWRLEDKKIRREFIYKNFVQAVDFINRIADVAEYEDHHPDLHLVGYRNVAVEIWTHAVGGLTENDFILAAKIDQLPVALKIA